MFDDRIRTSDADREQVAARLRDAYAEGRLTHEELDERISAALNAKTFGDLGQVLTDLPGPKLAAYQPKRPAGSAGPGYRRPVTFRHRPRVFPLLVLALLAVVLFSGAGAAVLALKLVAIIAVVMVLAFAAVAFAGAMFFRRLRRQWMQQFDGAGLGGLADRFGADRLGAWADRFGADRFGADRSGADRSGPGQFRFQSWDWPPRHHHHHHHSRWSRDSDYRDSDN
jgi:hypothetical protein